jgi:hypothetical protein
MRDCRKYNDLGLMGLTVVRFAWEHVMVERAYARAVLAQCANRQTPVGAPVRLVSDRSDDP